MTTLQRLNVVTLCTGNVARSVMLGYMLTTLAESAGVEWTVRTAGTHVTEGSAMSSRTRDALLKIDGLGDHRYGAHRSHQLDASDCAWADVILAAEADNVIFIRTNFSQFADKAVQLAQLVGAASLGGDLSSSVGVASQQEPSKEFDVADPAGGDQAIYDACARQLWDLAQAFAIIVGGERAD
jgi:protein-tyrosine-phosphatase